LRWIFTPDPADHVGTCPLKINFSGHIQVAGGPGKVSYRWASSDGERSPVQTLEFTASEKLEVSSSWTVDRTTVPTHAGWSSIEITDPAAGDAADRQSPHADYVFTCDSDNDIEAIGFGLGGSDADCSLTSPARTFAPDDPIRVDADWFPSLPAGTVVTMRLTRGGTWLRGTHSTSGMTRRRSASTARSRTGTSRQVTIALSSSPTPLERSAAS
jgi:hypothetical protein